MACGDSYVGCDNYECERPAGHEPPHEQTWGEGAGDDQPALLVTLQWRAET